MEQWLYDPVGMLMLGGQNRAGRVYGALIIGELCFIWGRAMGMPGLGTIGRLAGGYIGSYIPVFSRRLYGD